MRLKKILSILTFLIVTFTSINVYADKSTGVLNDSNITKAEMKILKAESDAKDKLISESLKINYSELNQVLPMSTGYEYYTIDVTNYAQETTYWCGPASAKQTLSFHKSITGSGNSLPSQSQLAIDSGTTTSGTSSANLKNALNKYASTFYFTNHLYVAADIANTSNPGAILENRLAYDIRNKYDAPILLLQCQYLPRYNGLNIRHYNTSSGYYHELSTGDKQIRNVDPHYNAAYRGIFWDELGNTTINSVARAVYQADLHGTNLVMVY
ncbi:MAG: C39 family peptidase [Clostridiaceae bacterium]